MRLCGGRHGLATWGDRWEAALQRRLRRQWRRTWFPAGGRPLDGDDADDHGDGAEELRGGEAVAGDLVSPVDGWCSGRPAESPGRSTAPDHSRTGSSNASTPCWPRTDRTDSREGAATSPSPCPSTAVSLSIQWSCSAPSLLAPPAADQRNTTVEVGSFTFAIGVRPISRGPWWRGPVRCSARRTAWRRARHGWRRRPSRTRS